MPGLSIAALAVVVPMISAGIVSAGLGGWAEVWRLFAFLAHRGRSMLPIGLIAVAIPLVVAGTSWGFANPAARTTLALSPLLSLLPVFIVAAIAEELGWSAFASERLVPKIGVLTTGLVVGLVWASWHIPALVELGRSPGWIAWWSVWTIAQRVVMVRLYVSARSWIWAPVLFHAASNVAWQMAPDAFDPAIEGLAMTVAAIASALVVTTFPRSGAPTSG